MVEKEKKQEVKNTLKIIKENHLDFIYDLHLKGVDVGPTNIEELKKKGYIQKEALSKEEKKEIITESINKSILQYKTEKNINADANVDIIQSSEEFTPFEFITTEELTKRKNEYGHIFEGRKEPIKREEWAPKSATDHERDFIDWIDSINKNGVKGKIHYRKFNLYVQQAYTWLSENITLADFDDDDIREDYKQNELKRCDENNLYFLNKYIWYKEGNAKDGSGKLKYVARETHEVLCYLDDCGYSIIIAKGRQQAITTTIMSINCRDVIFKTNHFMKFITEDDKKAVEIFDDKLKYPYSQLPDWMRPIPQNERDNLFKIGYKSEKGKKEGVGSKIEVVVPKRTAVAGGAPQKVLIDEAGNIPILGEMIGNARPTMYFANPDTQKLEITRKIWIYGTGGEMDKGGKAFETEYMAIKKDWDERKFNTCIVPLFFNWRCRMFATEEQREMERQVAYGKAENPSDPKGKQHITEFYQSWPETLEDVFRTSAKTLLDSEYIESNLKRIRDAKIKNGHSLHQSGYFEPVYDKTKPVDDEVDPWKIIDAVFVPTPDNDVRTSTTIFLHPKKEWADRYYQGTDPIDTDTGLSDFASTIWDDYFNTTAAILHWRIADYPQVFRQAMLMGIYYDDVKKQGIRELLESNRGSAYYQYQKNKGFGKRAVLNYELPDYLQNRTTKNEGVGIDSHGDRTQQLVNLQYNMFKTYGTGFYHEILFQQSKTFVCRISDPNKVTGKGGGTQTWGPQNKKYFKDDTLWSTTYSYICAKMCFPYIVPKNIEVLKTSYKIVTKLVRGKDNTLHRTQVREKVYNG